MAVSSCTTSSDRAAKGSQSRVKCGFRTKVTMNYQSAWSWDICSLDRVDEMLRIDFADVLIDMDQESNLEDVHLRILRVTEDLRAIQRELNCIAMETPGNPELMEAINRLPEIESVEILRTALDQMRHFLWFYMQVVTTDSEFGEKIRESIRQKPSHDELFKPEARLDDRLRSAAEALMLNYLADGKIRKPN